MRWPDDHVWFSKTRFDVESMLETERLILRQARRADIPELFEFLGDPVAMQHTHSDRTLRECQRRVMVHEWRRRRDGCAPWVVIRREDRRIIGWGGLYEDPFDPGWDFEVGYYFRPEVWGKGYASELVNAALSCADDQLKLPEVWAMAHPDNGGSRRVLEKAGFEFMRHLHDRNRLLFRRLRPFAVS
ncbi:ribosomal-protein-alanine N-acetyltransferase [Agrobacterium larrymoorei]|uniref:Ribosomal-protein-alanine N-acetyltransferase n=1 Tax=Agrobacterium larrymoorei TaxID=160699 RepID=A0AAJ2BB20_9HYPH|nr:GNAT family N-acetyltransferase [Agrobacterium larrymoorei]MDR6102374.1 ribosomal-protein-alanine N-acetyltransferase [Agrobacterium larrymoorei]